MFRLVSVFVISFFALFNVMPIVFGNELSSETLSNTLKKLGIYNNNKVSINGQLYRIENVSVSSNRRDFTIKFSAKPTE